MIKALIIDDSAFIRRVVTKILTSDPEIKVVGTAESGKEGIGLVKKLRPTVVVLDYEMPGMNGLQVTRELMKAAPVPIVILSGHMSEDSAMALQCLEAGALGIVVKPGGSYSTTLGEVQEQLIAEVKGAASVSKEHLRRLIGKTVTRIMARPKVSVAFPVIAIGASTGGPRVLEELVAALPPAFSGALVIVQHMPASMTPHFAKRLNSLSTLLVKEADDGEEIKPGVVYLCPGDRHLVITERNQLPLIKLIPRERVYGQYPSIDMLFESAGRVFAKRAVAVILSGIGQDGLLGAKTIRDIGGTVICEDEASAATYGMPGAVIEKKLANFVLSPRDIAKKLTELGRG